MECKNSTTLTTYSQEHICQEQPTLKKPKFSKNNNEKLKIVDDFDALSKECLKSLKEEYIKSFYTKFGTNEKEFLEKRFSQFFEHSVFGGKMTRSQLSFSVFKLLQQNTSSTLAVDSKSALKVILSIELLQAVFLVIDDVMDGAETRRGKPCWYKMPSVGMAALNHALRLQNFVNISILNAIPTHQNLGEILKV
uniref:Farnesyl pyrophosphate synthase n=1 Tax=Panagrolaimus sp. ES5 TaxID=591445 RepID=A0AC34GGL2_9BILA